MIKKGYLISYKSDPKNLDLITMTRVDDIEDEGTTIIVSKNKKIDHRRIESYFEPPESRFTPYGREEILYGYFNPIYTNNFLKNGEKFYKLKVGNYIMYEHSFHIEKNGLPTVTMSVNKIKSICDDSIKLILDNGEKIDHRQVFKIILDENNLKLYDHYDFNFLPIKYKINNEKEKEKD